MFGMIVIGQNGDVALGLMNEQRAVSAVNLYLQTRMVSVTTTEGDEVFMSHEVHPDIIPHLQEKKLIYVGHVLDDDVIEREYEAKLIVTP